MNINLLELDLKSLYPYVIEAFTNVYGEEFQEHIKNKLEHTIINTYNDINGLQSYIYHIKSCKNRELSLKFLEKNGINIERYKKENYTDAFDNELENIVKIFLYSSYSSFSEENQYFWIPICAFDPKNETDERILIKFKIKILNFIRNNPSSPITEENFTDFSKTEEYQELLKRINQIYTMYKEIREEYNTWYNSFPYLKLYEEYIASEIKRKEEILENYKNITYKAIFFSLPFPALKELEQLSYKEQQEGILGKDDLSFQFNIEYFKQEEMEKLKSPETNIWYKYTIIRYQSQYLKSLGIKTPYENSDKKYTKENIQIYIDFISQESIQKFIPSEEVINYIQQIREKKYKEAIKKYITTRNDFKRIMNIFSYTPNNVNYLYNLITNRSVCILSEGQYNAQNEFISFMFFTIRPGDCDKAFHNFFHEAAHAIDQNSTGTGFEPLEDYRENGHKNPYDSKWRKYERFSETINDIFTIEALNYLKEKGIYLISPKEFTTLDTSNHNSFLLVKNLLKPLIEKFRAQVIKAKLSSNPNYLIHYIGKDNYEALVDIVNKVDFLCHNGLKNKLKNRPNDTMVLEYYAELEKLANTYINIDNYYENNFGEFSKNELPKPRNKFH